MCMTSLIANDCFIRGGSKSCGNSLSSTSLFWVFSHKFHFVFLRTPKPSRKCQDWTSLFYRSKRLWSAGDQGAAGNGVWQVSGRHIKVGWLSISMQCYWQSSCFIVNTTANAQISELHTKYKKINLKNKRSFFCVIFGRPNVVTLL